MQALNCLAGLRRLLLLLSDLQLEVVEPGAVLMWIFGSILTLLWLLFVCYGELSCTTQLVGVAAVMCTQQA